MTSLASSGGVGKCKKNNNSVIYKTTSETLRLGDDTTSSSSIINNKLTITSSATISRKKSQIQSPSCSFQITGIMTRYDQEDESADDLDESHTDEISRVTDNETPSYSEDSRDDQQLLYSSTIVQNNQNNLQNLQQPQQQQPQHTIITAPNVLSSSSSSSSSVANNFTTTTTSSVINIIKPSSIIIEEPPKENKDEINKKIKSNINKTNDLGRFRVVKLGSMAPFSRGRWTCYDYIDESLDINNSKFLYTGSTLILPDKAVYLSLTNNATTDADENNLQFNNKFQTNNSNNNLLLDSNKNNNTAIIINTTSSSNNKDNNEIIVNEKNEKNNEILVNNSTENSESSGICSATIDTKIEHALDVVKNHLTHAVRLEVEELKIKINELVERISYLENENDLLRSTVNPDVLQNLENQPRN